MRGPGLLLLYMIFGACVAWVVSCDTPGNTEPAFKNYYIKYLGEDGDQEGKDFVVNTDGTIIIAGTTMLGQLKRIYLVKVDPEGNEIWKKTLGSFDNETAQDIEPITSGQDAGNFVVLSNVERGGGDFNIRLTVINSSGDSLKSVLIDDLESQEAVSVTPLAGGGYYVSGKTAAPVDSLNASLPPREGGDKEDVLVIRLTDSFAYTYPESFALIGNSYEGSAIKIFEGPSSNFYYAGYSDELTGVETSYEKNFVFRSFIDNPASVSTFYSGTSTRNEQMTAITRSPSGLYMAIGTQTDFTGGEKQIYLSLLSFNFPATPSPDFTPIQKDGTFGIGSQREGVAIAPAGVSKFLLLANEINAVGNRNIYLSKINFFFDIDFEIRFGAAGNDDTASAVAELPNGDILVLGTLHLTNQKKIALIKLRSNGQF